MRIRRKGKAENTAILSRPTPVRATLRTSPQDVVLAALRSRSYGDIHWGQSYYPLECELVENGSSKLGMYLLKLWPAAALPNNVFESDCANF